MQKFSSRLRLAMERASLTIADAARLFDRERRTVSDWVNLGRSPTGAREQEAFECLAQLESSIAAKRGFPVPRRLSKRNRVRYITLIREGKVEAARIFAEDLTA